MLNDAQMNIKKREPNVYAGSRLKNSVRARGFEPPTFWSVAKRSIQLS